MVTSIKTKAPDVGSMLQMHYKKHKINRAALARKLNLHRVTVAKYDQRSSLHVRVLWDVAIALEHNFFADIAAQMPKEYATNVPQNNVQAERIAALEAENALLKSKVETLMQVVGK
ncbi:hypothetical protein [Aequorivita echinoideorum]|uniref:HTH cro/C1-type domain-containing protein n=1 Tax=Aequorivita echinoideorum TaxID=1549647 RepID=A0ABS5S8E4_9FLAO|nr:hypothetical protein [Aequorivita echinoideorum]MBT0608622.1 hypothetical protein [Aequorivita echinoideorum]